MVKTRMTTKGKTFKVSETEDVYLSYHASGKIEGSVSLDFDCPRGCALRSICYVRKTFNTCKSAEQRYKRNSQVWDNGLIPSAILDSMADWIKKVDPIFFRPCSAGNINSEVSADNLARLFSRIRRSVPIGVWITDDVWKWREILKSNGAILNYSNKSVDTVASAPFMGCDNSFNLFTTAEKREEMITAAKSIGMKPYICAKKCVDCKKRPCYTGRNYAILEEMKK